MTTTEPPVTRLPIEAMSPRHRVLVCDDTDAETWIAYLSGLDCDTKVATSADVLGCVADWRPDLVLLCPVKSAGGGFAICRQIKQSAGTPTTRVLMVAQFNDLGAIERAIEAGTDDFLSKPANKTELVNRVENLLNLGHL